MSIPEFPVRSGHRPHITQAQPIAVRIRHDVGIALEVWNHFLNELVDLGLIRARYKAGIVGHTSELSDPDGLAVLHVMILRCP